MDATQRQVPTVTRNRSLARVLLTALISVAAIVVAALVLVDRSGRSASAAGTIAADAASPAVIDRPVVATSSGGDRAATGTPPPDAQAEYTGGLAARLHTADGVPVPGDLFMLMGLHGSDAPARLYDETPFTHDNGTARDTHESNVAANATAAAVVGADLELLEFTTAAAGGPSGGIAYTIAYLNVVSGGAFTGDLRVAATGRIGSHGYVEPISAIDEKAAAAHLAGANVLFTPSAPSDEQLRDFSARSVGERFRARHTGEPLAEERLLDRYEAWGSDRPGGMDLVHVRHVADVAAYLCGAGSTFACDIRDRLADTTTALPYEPLDVAPSTLDRRPAGVQ